MLRNSPFLSRGSRTMLSLSDQPAAINSTTPPKHRPVVEPSRGPRGPHLAQAAGLFHPSEHLLGLSSCSRTDYQRGLEGSSLPEDQTSGSVSKRSKLSSGAEMRPASTGKAVGELKKCSELIVEFYLLIREDCRLAGWRRAVREESRVGLEPKKDGPF